MRVVTLSRKPCAASSTTANVVEHHAGALNVDGTRLGFTSAADQMSAKPGGRATAKSGSLAGKTQHPDRDRKEFVADNSKGRWPANVVLQHRPGCVQTGTATAPGYTINRFTDGAKPFGGGAGHEYESEKQSDEEIAVWRCAEGCSVQEMGAQSGTSRGTGGDSSGSSAFGQNSGWNQHNNRPTKIERPHDEGTAARYFKQVQERDDMNDPIPEELVEYLVTMILPPPSCEPLVVVCWDLESYPWEELEDDSVHGMITTGNPEEFLDDIDRVLRPGAHLLIVAPDDEPTGHTGACAVEDFGYEIRDAIAVLDTPGEFNYVAKASSAERNAGVTPTVNESGRQVANSHPTVKPVAIMEGLLEDVPEGALVVDAFMGSGTTGIACLRTGHNFIGIDQDRDYLSIADQRIRYWNSAQSSWNSATIESEIEEDDDGPVGLGDFFGM